MAFHVECDQFFLDHGGMCQSHRGPRMQSTGELVAEGKCTGCLGPLKGGRGRLFRFFFWGALFPHLVHVLHLLKGVPRFFAFLWNLSHFAPGP